MYISFLLLLLRILLVLVFMAAVAGPTFRDETRHVIESANKDITGRVIQQSHLLTSPHYVSDIDCVSVTPAEWKSNALSSAPAYGTRNKQSNPPNSLVPFQTVVACH